MSDFNLRIPHRAVQKAMGLLHMEYTVSELSVELGVPNRTIRDWLMKFGAPHRRDSKRHIFIEGEGFAQWLETHSKKQAQVKLNDNEAYCLNCRKGVEMNNPIKRPLHGKLAIKYADCPDCGKPVAKGTRA